MINLLPKDQLAAIKSDYYRRRLTVFGALILAWVLIVALCLSALLILARSDRQILAGQITAQQQLLTAADGGSTERLSRLAQDLATITTAERARVLPSRIWQPVLAAKPAGVKIDRLEFDFSGAPTVDLAGVADSRRVLLDFLEKLRADATFSAVDSPASNLIKETNVSFALKLHLNPRHE